MMFMPLGCNISPHLASRGLLPWRDCDFPLLLTRFCIAKGRKIDSLRYIRTNLAEPHCTNKDMFAIILREIS